VYVPGHAGGKAALFLLAGIVLNRYGSVDEISGDRAGPGGRVPPRRVLAAETRRRCASLTA
jgi:hypothetical protein